MSYLLSDYPSYSNGIFSNLTNNYGYILFTSNGSFTFNKNVNYEILVVGAGGRGGNGSLSGGGGSGGSGSYYPQGKNGGTGVVIIRYLNQKGIIGG